MLGDLSRHVLQARKAAELLAGLEHGGERQPLGITDGVAREEGKLALAQPVALAQLVGSPALAETIPFSGRLFSTAMTAIDRTAYPCRDGLGGSVFTRGYEALDLAS